MASPFTDTTKSCCDKPVNVGTSKTWTVTLPLTGSQQLVCSIYTTNINTEFSIDNATWRHNLQASPYDYDSVDPVSSFVLYVRFTPTDVNDVPGEIKIIETP